MVEHLGVESVLSGVKTQIYAVLVGAMHNEASHGTSLGWTSPALPVLLSNSTPLITGPLTNDELSWIASLSGLGSVFGTFICGALSMWLGCKHAMVFLAFPPIIFWLLVYFGNTYYHIFWARLIGGLTGGGFQSGVTLFVSEIANNNIRGRLGTITPLARNLGLLMGFFAGAIVPYQYRPFVFIWIPVAFLILILLLSNTPQFYLRKQKFTKAEKALKYYKGCNGTNERDNIYLAAEFERMKLVEEERRRNKSIQLKDLCCRDSLRGIYISIAISWFSLMTGCYTITNYASIIFELSGTVFGINISSIVLAVVQIVGGLLSTQIGDAFGRKTILIFSLIGSIVGLASLSVYLYLKHIGYDVSNYVWIPLLSLSLVIFITSSGILALSNICAVENFPLKIRAAGMVWYSLCNNGISFIGDKFFPIFMKWIYLHGVLLFLVGNCLVGLIFVAFMKETKGKSLDSFETDEKYSSTQKSTEQQKY